MLRWSDCHPHLMLRCWCGVGWGGVWWGTDHVPCCLHPHLMLRWETESCRLRLTFRNVAHYRMEFCRKTNAKNKVKISASQKLDQMWRQLKCYIPYNVATKDRCTKRDSEQLETYTWSYAWRYSNKTQMKERRAKLPEKKNKNAWQGIWEGEKKGPQKAACWTKTFYACFP